MIEEFKEPNVQEEEKEEKNNKKDFSLMGLLSIFSKKEETKEERIV